MLFELLQRWGAWNWVIGGLVLLGLDMIVPGASLIWFGLAALAVGILALSIAMSWQVQVALFCLFSVFAVYVVRRVLALREQRGDPLRLNDRARRLYGHAYPLSEPILNGVGRIRVDDTTWGVAGPDLPGGTLVRVTGHDGTLLTVVRYEN